MFNNSNNNKLIPKFGIYSLFNNDYKIIKAIDVIGQSVNNYNCMKIGTSSVRNSDCINNNNIVFKEWEGFFSLLNTNINYNYRSSIVTF
jgi:hypothetical protein